MYTVYKITHIPSDKSYIGQTKNSANHRFIEHLSTAVLENKPSGKLEHLMVISDASDFKVETLETNIASRSEALVKENEYIHKYDTVKNGLNNNYGSIKYNEGKINRIRKDYMNGESLEDIANNFKCSIGTVRNIMLDRFKYEHVIFNYNNLNGLLLFQFLGQYHYLFHGIYQSK